MFTTPPCPGGGIARLRLYCILLGALPGAQAVLSQEPALGLHAGSDYTLNQYEAFGAWLGRDVMYRIVFVEKTSWELIGNGAIIPVSKQWVNSKPGRVEVISLPLLADPDEGRFAVVADGSRDSVFQSLAQRIRNADIDDRVIIRLGWEGNGDWYPWSFQQDPAGYRAAFRRVAKVMRAVAPGLRFDFNISNGAKRPTNAARWNEGYPGDDVVDVISMDIYDQFNRWSDMMAGEAGLYEFREFAKARKKVEAYAEWACCVTSNGNGDNAGFIRAMASWMAARPGKVLYQAYWNTTDGAGALLFGATQHLVADAATTFRRTFGLNTAPEITPIADQTISVNGSTGPLAFTIDDGQTPIERLQLIVNSSNPALVPVSHIRLGGGWKHRSVTITPAVNRTGWSTVWVKVDDGALNRVISFVVYVQAELAFSDVGSPLLTGAGNRVGNTLALQAGGYDIYSRRDEFLFGQARFPGDVELTARVASLTPTHPWAKAGLMLRGSLAPEAPHVAVFVTASQGVVMQWRARNGEGTASSPPLPGRSPQWLRLIRTDDFFLSYCSTDGRTWEFVAAIEVDLPDTALGGVAYTSHAPLTLGTAVFDSFAVD